MQKHFQTKLFSLILGITFLLVPEFANAGIISLPRYTGEFAYRSNSGGRDKTCSSSYKYACSGSGYAGGSGTSCNDLYTSCSCSANYKWSGGSCVLKSCSDYGYSASKDNTKSCEEKTPRSGLTCYVCTGCDSSTYKYACSGGLNASTQGTSNKCGTNYSKCECVANASWNSTSGKCECGSDYKSGTTSCTLKTCEDYGYLATEDTTKNCTKQTPRSGLACWNCSDCTGTLYDCGSISNASGGSGTACGGKYPQCTCKDLYRWDNGTCKLNCTRNSCSTTTYPLTAQNAANASSYEKCTPSCSDELPRYKVSACASGYNVNSNGSGCDAVPTKTCAEVLTIDGYTLVTNEDELKKANGEFVLMNDVTASRSINIYGYVYTPEYFHSEYSQCSGTPTLSTSGDISIRTGGDSFDIWPNLKADTTGIYDDNNRGTAVFYGNVDTYNLYSEESANVTIYANLTVSSDLYITEGALTIASGGVVGIDPSNTDIATSITFENGATAYQDGCYEGCSGYVYTVTSNGTTKYKANGSSIQDLPFGCEAKGYSYNTWKAICSGTLSYSCKEKSSGKEVALSYCQNCGTAGSLPTSAESISSECRACTINSNGYCSKASAYVKCVWKGETTVSSDRYDDTYTYSRGDNCGKNYNSKEYIKIWNCYESCGRYGAGITYGAAQHYGYSSDEAFYASDDLAKWCRDWPRSVCEANNRLDPICDYDNFCDCFYHCSDSERFDRCLNTSMCK